MAKTIKPGSANTTSAKFVKPPAKPAPKVMSVKQFNAAVKASRAETAKRK